MTIDIRSSLPKALSALTGGAILAALVFAPLAFGAVEPWAYSILTVLAYAALAAAQNADGDDLRVLPPRVR